MTELSEFSSLMTLLLSDPFHKNVLSDFTLLQIITEYQTNIPEKN